MRSFIATLLVVAVVPAAGSARLDAQRTAPPLLTYVPPTGGLCLVRADGSHRVRLTPRGDVDGPAWSPRGRYVAFHEHVGPSDPIAVANARGRILWLIGDNDGILGGALWSPDGHHIAYSRGAAGPNGYYELVVSRPSGAQKVAIGSSWDPAGEAHNLA